MDVSICGAPQLLVDSGGRSGRMYFRKTYEIKGKRNRTGEVLQELRRVKEGDGWKIISERDLRAIRHQRRQLQVDLPIGVVSRAAFCKERCVLKARSR